MKVVRRQKGLPPEAEDAPASFLQSRIKLMMKSKSLLKSQSMMKSKLKSGLKEKSR